MDLIFDEKPGQIVDFMLAMHLVYNRNLQHKLNQYNLPLKREKKKIYEYFIKIIDTSDRRLEFYFKDETDAFFMFYDGKAIWQLGTIDRFIDALKSAAPDDLRRYLLSYLAGPDSDDVNIGKLLADHTSAIGFIRNLDIPDSVKWNAVDFLNDPVGHLSGIMSYIENFACKYLQILEKNEGLMRSIANSFQKELDARGETILRDEFNGIMEVSKYERVYISTTFFCNYVLMVEDGGDGSLYLFLGHDYEVALDGMRGKNDEEHVLTVLKAISEPTKYKIISLLNNNTYYGQELADKLGLSLATISHHMELLNVAAGVVKIEITGNKVYYSLNKEALEKCVIFLKDKFGLKGD